MPEELNPEEKLLEKRLQELDSERQAVLDQLKKLKAVQEKGMAKNIPLRGQIATSKTPITPQEKIDLFIILFRCRESVYPRLWENPHKKTRKSYRLKDVAGKNEKNKA